MCDLEESHFEPDYEEDMPLHHIQGSTLSKKGENVLYAKQNSPMSDDMLYKNTFHGTFTPKHRAGYVNLVLVKRDSLNYILKKNTLITLLLADFKLTSMVNYGWTK